MYETIVKVDGMMCSMCEAHINDTVRSAVSAKKVTSSRKKGETTIQTAQEPDVETIKAAISATGYTPGDISVKQLEKRGLFQKAKSETNFIKFT